MVILLTNGQARTAHVTMIKLLLGTYTTDAAAVAMKCLLLIPLIIIHIAYAAEVLAELYAALLTILLWFLNIFALETAYLGDSMPIHLMVLLRVHLIIVPLFIVAKAACEEFFAPRAPLLAPGSVMLAAFSLIIDLLLLLKILIVIFVIARIFRIFVLPLIVVVVIVLIRLLIELFI